MYEFIKGTISEISPAHAVLATSGGVGYYLNISLQTFTRIKELTETILFTHFIVRDDAQILFGFADRGERDLFRMLIGVSGVGGNTARTILSTFNTEELRIIIATGKAEVLKEVKGLGIKTAQKIIVELKDKVAAVGGGTALTFEDPKKSPVFEEALSAMLMLGFAKAPAEKVIRNIIKEEPGISVEEIIRKSLKNI
ncbi:MAG: Holliday junction branch migration protein RuvA [Rikenellaceae bacterium]|nr:Holliday junction branch migration protein RuvA [Rikenellaceae bacterium]